MMNLDEAIKHCKEKGCGYTECAAEHKQLAQWLMELKCYKEQKPAWSEEDEVLLKLSLENLTEIKNRFGEDYGRVGGCIDWLKFLKERYTWKPSEEQMSALKEQCVCKKSTAAGAVLCELFHDLEKLKG